MLEPAQTLPDTSAEVSVEEGVQSKPIRKRAPKKPRAGLVKGMRVQIKPTPEQAVKLAQWAGASRWLWNWALAKQQAYYAQHQKSLGSAATWPGLGRIARPLGVEVLPQLPAI